MSIFFDYFSGSLNCTFMELKFDYKKAKEFKPWECLNCTFMELK